MNILGKQRQTGSSTTADATAGNTGKVAEIIDYLVMALGSDPGCTLRRALILVDIDEHPGTTQSAILERLKPHASGLHKSAINRDTDWLYDYGCILRQSSPYDAREVTLSTRSEEHTSELQSH